METYEPDPNYGDYETVVRKLKAARKSVRSIAARTRAEYEAKYADLVEKAAKANAYLITARVALGLDSEFSKQTESIVNDLEVAVKEPK